ncbi:hypothetical protein [Flavihumibacter fluvii]|uniref:hypothetical protein n=1 Tax=Flavihumibacter fluvii TaxID=2838157 RepID=UPI001BDF456B|nr:hypothetical protein [Flavihumibacter fluvii]ULQ51389.1 hypothetical protein KJS93_14975 [Flavihumibacter fluvii]
MRGIFIWILLLGMHVAIAQKNSDDVIHLKNGGAVRGKILADSALQVKIQTADGSIWVFRKDEIDFISKEARFRTFSYKDKGFAHFTELGPLVAGKTTIEGVTTAAFSFQMVNGYKFNQYLFTGIGAGVDLYATQSIIPVFGSIRGDISKNGTIIPFYFIDAGYGINITQNSSAGSDFGGGLMYAGGLGVKIPFNRSAGFLLSIGYRMQKTNFVQESQVRNIEYRRLALRAGFWL